MPCIVPIRFVLAAALSTTLAAGGCEGRASSHIIFIRNVDVVDVVAGTIRPGVSVVVRDGRIAAIDEAASQPPGATTIDGSGRYLIPGLWEMHAHLSDFGTETLALYLEHGVTGVRDAGGSLDTLGRWQRAIREGTLAGPTIVAAGPVLESGPWLERLPRIERLVDSLGAPPVSYRSAIERLPVSDAATARAAVDSVIARGGAFVKARTYLDSTTFLAVARRARERGVGFVGHPPPRGVSWIRAAAAGMTGIEHMGGSYLAELGQLGPENRRSVFEALARVPVYLDPNVVGEAARAMPDSLAAAVVEDTAGLRFPQMRTLPRRLLERFRRDLAIRRLESGMDPGRDWPASYRAEVGLLREAHQAGVPLVTGTDLASFLIFPGSSIHEELGLLVRDVGLTPLDALRAATINPARALGLAATHGSIDPGKAADLVLVEANPLDDIGNAGRIVTVIAAGRILTAK